MHTLEYYQIPFRIDDRLAVTDKLKRQIKTQAKVLFEQPIGIVIDAAGMPSCRTVTQSQADAAPDNSKMSIMASDAEAIAVCMNPDGTYAPVPNASPDNGLFGFAALQYNTRPVRVVPGAGPDELLFERAEREERT